MPAGSSYAEDKLCVRQPVDLPPGLFHALVVARVVSDRRSQFVSLFWQAMCKLAGMELPTIHRRIVRLSVRVAFMRACICLMPCMLCNRAAHLCWHVE